MEDMTERGFVMIDKPPENFEESKMIARKLGQFHAASFYLANSKVWLPNLILLISNPIYLFVASRLFRLQSY